MDFSSMIDALWIPNTSEQLRRQPMTSSCVRHVRKTARCQRRRGVKDDDWMLRCFSSLDGYGIISIFQHPQTTFVSLFKFSHQKQLKCVCALSPHTCTGALMTLMIKALQVCVTGEKDVPEEGKAKSGCKGGKTDPVCSQTFGDLSSFYSSPRVKSPKDKRNIYSVLTYSPFPTPAPSLSAPPAVTDRCSASAVISQHIKFC